MTAREATDAIDVLCAIVYDAQSALAGKGARLRAVEEVLFREDAVASVREWHERKLRERSLSEDGSWWGHRMAYRAAPTDRTM